MDPGTATPAARRKALAALALCIVCALLLLVSSLAAQERDRDQRGERGERGERGAGQPGGATAGRRYKNIQVLKNLPADQLLPTMRRFSASLGVRCDFCHAGRDFSADTKPEKRTARQMIRLVMDLNARERVLDRKATCYMCHHGHEQPETVAPAEPGGGPGRGPGGERERERGEGGERGGDR